MCWSTSRIASQRRPFTAACVPVQFARVPPRVACVPGGAACVIARAARVLSKGSRGSDRASSVNPHAGQGECGLSSREHEPRASAVPSPGCSCSQYCAASFSSRSASSLKATCTGQIRPRASRNTSSAGRLESSPDSSAAARRCASSAQMRAFSSGDRVSRLSSSRSARRARPFGSSFSAAASSSSSLIARFYAHPFLWRPGFTDAGRPACAQIVVVPQ